MRARNACRAEINTYPTLGKVVLLLRYDGVILAPLLPISNL